MGQRTKEMLRMFSQTWLNIVLVFMLLTASDADILWWQGQLISSEPVPDFFER
ncbi:mobilization A domain protein [Escherichia coli 2-427-07_S1_C2]|nr:mobilization A domain protein [Escherichia coli 2-427-07_S1_C2]